MSIETTLTLGLALVIFIVATTLRFVAVMVYRYATRNRRREAFDPALYPRRPGEGVLTRLGRGLTATVTALEYLVATGSSWTWGRWKQKVVPFCRSEFQWIGDVLGQTMYGGLASANGALSGNEIGLFLHDGFGPTVEVEDGAPSRPRIERRVVNISSGAARMRFEAELSRRQFEGTEDTEKSLTG